MAVVDLTVRGKTKDGSSIKGLIDYRAETPYECPKCGSPLELDHRIGHIYISGPADMEWAGKLGITEEGWYRTLSFNYHCRRDPEEFWGPIVLATA